MKVTKTGVEFTSEELFAIWFYQSHMVPRIIENLSDDQIKRFKLLTKKKK